MNNGVFGSSDASDGDFFVIGTAGHIDHGKTALVRSLTGVDTDQTREEKERGISINLGFAPLALADGRQLGIVDVPGHERFIRNMLAGAGGMDLILLVVDVREGIMPQTREHVAILEMLGVRRGVVVLTKIDLVDGEWASFVESEVRSGLSHSFLANAPLVAVSSVTGQGLPELRRAIEEELPRVKGRSRLGAFRMPIDRAFLVQGIGTVVTGTVWRGTVRVSDALELQPGAEGVRVRGIQVHGRAVESAAAGQRAAVALGGHLRVPAARGMTLSAPGQYAPSRLVDVHVQILADAPFSLAHRARVRFYTGTAEAMGRVLLLGASEIGPGGDGLAQVLLERETVCEARDHFVLRSYSPMATLGGGVVIDPHPDRLHRRHSALVRERLLRAESGSVEDRALMHLLSSPPASPEELAAKLAEPVESVREALLRMESDGRLARLDPSSPPVPRERLEEWREAVPRALYEFYEKNRYDVWVSRPSLAQAVRAKVPDARWFESLLMDLQRSGKLEVEGDRVRLPGRVVTLTPAERELRDALVEVFSSRPFDPPTPQDVERIGKGRERALRNILRLLEQERFLVSLGPDVQMWGEAVRRAEREALDLYREKGPFTAGDFRDRLGTSRKFAVAILEHLDRQKRTRRVGDAREFTSPDASNQGGML